MEQNQLFIFLSRIRRILIILFIASFYIFIHGCKKDENKEPKLSLVEKIDEIASNMLKLEQWLELLIKITKN